jgi:transcriptional regulator with XRE-family HTH domain
MGRKLMTPGDYIHDRRRDFGITRGEMARLIGVSDDRYRDIERHDRPPTDAQITAIARLLHIDPSVLLRRYGRAGGRPKAGGRAAAPAGPVPTGGPDVGGAEERARAAQSRTEIVTADTQEIRRRTEAARAAAGRDMERVRSTEALRAEVAGQLAAEQVRLQEARSRRAELISTLIAEAAAPSTRVAKTPATRRR